MEYKTPENSEGPFEDLGTSSTLMAHYPEYDRDGRPVSADPNTRKTAYRDISTDKKYVRVAKGWIHKYYVTDEKYFMSDMPKVEPFLVVDTTPDYLNEKEKNK